MTTDVRKTKAELIKELEALRQSEERYRQLFESANDLIVTFTMSGIITSVNRRVEGLLGWSRKEILGRHYREFLTPASMKLTEERTRRIQAGENVPSISEIELVRKDGSKVPVESRTRFMRDREGNVHGFLGIYRDLSARQRQTEELRRSKEQLALIFNEVSDLVFLIAVEPGSHFRYVAVNPSLLRITGFSEETLAGRTVEEVFPPAEAAAVADNYEAAVRAARPITYEEQRNLPSGQLRFETTLTPIFDEQGRCTHLLGTSHDITARKQAEEALRASEERYRNLFENANDAIAIVNLDRTVVNINRAMERLLGWSREELIGQSDHKILTPAGIALAEERERRIREGERVSSTFEHEFVRKDGSKVLVEGRTRFIRDRAGKPIGYQGIYRDISARRQAEEALRESEQRYRVVSELISDYAYAARIGADNTYTVEWFTETFTRVTGFTFDKEPYAPNRWRIVHPDDLPIVRERRRRLMTGQIDVSEFRIIRKDRAVRWIREYGRPIWDEEQSRVVRIYFAGRDITDRKQAEEALRESEQRYRGLVESQQDLIVRVDPQGRFTFVNDAYCKKFAKRREELLGSSFVPLVHEDDQAATLEALKKLEAPPYRVSLEQRALTADGWRWIAWEDYAIRDEHGKTLEIQAVGHDITDRKQAEAEKQQLQEQLFQARKLEALGTLAGGVAHDFNNILSAIMGFTELAGDDVAPGTVAHRNLQEVLKASRRAKALVQQILTFSQPVGRRQTDPVQLGPIIEEVLTFLRASIPQTIELRQHLDEAAGSVAIIPGQLRQVLSNLCHNAVQALNETGGVLEVRLEQIKVGNDLSHLHNSLHSGPHLRLTVRDTGCGMSPEIQGRIFEPFFTTRPVGEGNGLGLAIVHGIVTGHGGAVTVDSAVGRGTTFQVYLPVTEGSQQGAAPPRGALPEALALVEEKGESGHDTHLGH